MAEDYLERLIKIYEVVYKKDEMFLLGYLTACGREMILWKSLEHDIKLLEKDPEFWLPIVKEELEIKKELFEERLEDVRKLLREKLKDRGMRVPQWLES